MRILLVKTSSLGDVIHNLPVLSDLHRQLPEARIDWVVEENFIDLPRLHPAIGRVIPVAIRRWRKALLSGETWREIGLFRRSLAETPYDQVIDTQGLVKSALISRLAPLRPDGHRNGHDRDSVREPLAARSYDRHFAIPRDHHAVERNRELVAAALGYTAALPNLSLDYGITAPALREDWLPQLPLTSPQAGQAPYAVLLTATSRDDKLWPEDHWIRLGHALHEQGLPCVLPAGSARERERAARIATHLPNAVTAPTMGLKALASLFVGARQVVGLDTGLTHLAAALHRPTVALFTGSNPGLTGVHAGPLALNLGGIGQVPTVHQVLAALGKLPTEPLTR